MLNQGQFLYMEDFFELRYEKELPLLLDDEMDPCLIDKLI
jgi:hypothetical protein